MYAGSIKFAVFELLGSIGTAIGFFLGGTSKKTSACTICP